MFSSKDVSHMAKFNGGNFPFWKFQVNLIFEQHKLLGVIDGTENCPEL